MATALVQVWYVRKSGWVQGPFTANLMRQMYATAWVGALDQIASSKDGPWRTLRDFPELVGSTLNEPPAVRAEEWELASPRFTVRTPMELGMLQMFAASGRLRPNDLVRQLPDGGWQPARLVEGVFGGRRSWCMACGKPLGNDHTSCGECGAAQPDYEPSLAIVAFPCGLIAVAWTVVALFAVTTLAIRRATIFGFAMEESFPEAYALTMIAPLWLAIAAIVLGHGALNAVRFGRSTPADADQAFPAVIMGWTTLGILFVTAVGVISFSLPYFRMVH